MVATPTIEPQSARAGDTWRWTRSLSAYPATAGWTLKYRLLWADAAEEFSASPDGASFVVELSPVVTSSFAQGRAALFSWVEKGADATYERVSLGNQPLEILPNLAVADSHDGRSHARIMLAAIESILEGRASAGDLDTVRAAWGDVATERDAKQLRELRALYAAQVSAEDAAEAAARGYEQNFVQMRFR